jgi:hypothetical protein
MTMTMKTPSLALIILTVLVLNACTSRSVDYSKITEFNTVKEIEFEEHSVAVLLGMPMDMLIMNDLVIILDGQTDRFFHALSIEDYSHMGSFIRRGRGPGEEEAIAPYIKAYEGNQLLYQTMHDLKAAKVTKTDSSIDIVIHNTFDLPESLRMGSDFFLVNDVIFNSNSLHPNSKDYLVFNKETRKVSEWGESPPVSEMKISPELLATHNSKLTTFNLKEDRIASVFHSLPLLRIYSLENEKLIVEHSMADPSHNLNTISSGQILPGDKGLVNYYQRIKSTDDYIYALYAGFSVADHYKEGEVPHIFDWSGELHIWKWDGTPVMKLILDRPVFAFDVTPDNRKIIATSVVDVDNLFVAEIPWN